MLRVTLSARLLAATLLLLLSQQSSGDEPSTKNDAAKKYRALVAQLVSPNKQPIAKHDFGDASVQFPKEYDVQAQRRIQESRQTLHDNLEESLPYLIEALSDERYCMTISWAEGDAYYNCSVGTICKDVIASQLEVYRNQIPFNDPQHWKRYDYAISKEWWEQRKGRKVAELQVEAIDWATVLLKADQQVRRDEKMKAIADMQKLRDEITRSGKAAKSQRHGMLRMITSGK